VAARLFSILGFFGVFLEPISASHFPAKRLLLLCEGLSAVSLDKGSLPGS
jgi:hypothetical protein